MKSLEKSLVILRNAFFKKAFNIIVLNSLNVIMLLKILHKRGFLFNYTYYNKRKILVKSKFFVYRELRILYKSSKPEYLSARQLAVRYSKKRKNEILIVSTTPYGIRTVDQAIFLNVGGFLVCVIKY